MKIAGGIHGDIATASIVVNSIPQGAGSAAPGLRTMRDLPLPSFFRGKIGTVNSRPFTVNSRVMSNSPKATLSLMLTRSDL